MVTHDALSLERIAQRYLGRFPDLHGLARQAAGHVIRRQLGYWLDSDRLYWHEFESAASSSLSFTGWRHRGPPRRSLTLTQLVMQRFSPDQQANADQLSTYGGFYRVDASHAEYDERNEVRLMPQAVLETFWSMDFVDRYRQLLEQFRERHGEDFCVLARARFLSAVGHAALTRDERFELLAATLAEPGLPASVQALRLDLDVAACSGWKALSIGGIVARTLWLRTLKTGRHCLYLADDRSVLQVFDDRHMLQTWLGGQALTSEGLERLVSHFVGGDALLQSLRPRLNQYFKLLAASRGDVSIVGPALVGDLFVRLREHAMDELASNAHERLTSNAELSKAQWLEGLQASSLIIAPMTPLGWPVALLSLGIGAGSLALHLDQAINGKSAWRAAAWWLVVLDVLFILLNAALMREAELFTRERLSLRDDPPTVDDSGWERYMRADSSTLLNESDLAVERQKMLLGAVPEADAQSLGAAGEYLDAFSEPLAVYRDELGYGSPAINEYSHSPGRYNDLWRGRVLEGDLAVYIHRSHRLAEALEQIGARSGVRLYRAASSLRGTGNMALQEGRLAVGDVLVTTDFTSFTENPYSLWEAFNSPQVQASGRAAFDDSAVVYVLEPGEDVQATPVAPFSERKDEAESLMLPGRYLRIEQMTRVRGAGYRFLEVRLKALGNQPLGRPVYDMRTGEVFDREALAQRLGAGDDSLMRRFFPLPT